MKNQILSSGDLVKVMTKDGQLNLMGAKKGEIFVVTKIGNAQLGIKTPEGFAVLVDEMKELTDLSQDVSLHKQPVDLPSGFVK